MRTMKYLQFTLAFLLSLNAYAQNENEIRLMENWAYESKEGKYEKLNKMITASNGYIVAVGETVGASGADADGLFIVLDPNDDGNEITKKTFGKGGDQVFNSVAQNNDGTFTIVGYTTSSSNTFKEGWVLQVDVNGEVVFGDKPARVPTFEGELTDIAINSEDIAVAVGIQFNKKVSRNWLVQIENEGFPVNRQLSNENFGAVQAIAAGSDGNFIVIGNTNKGNRRHPEQIWAINVDREGNNQWGEPQFYGDKGLQTASDISPLIDGSGFAIVGTTNSKSKGLSDVWLLKIDQRGGTIWQNNYGGKDVDIGNAVIELSEGGYAILAQSRSKVYKARYSVPIIIITDEKGNAVEEDQYPIYGSEVDNIGHSITETIEGESLVFTASTFDQKKQQYPRCFLGSIDYKRRPLEDYIAPGDERFGSNNQSLTMTPAIFFDATGDNYLSPTERGYFMIEVTNESNQNLHNISGEVFDPSNSAGLDYWKDIKLGTIRAKQTKRLYVPVKALGELPEGPVALSVDLKVEETFAASGVLSIEESGSVDPPNVLVERGTFEPGRDPQPNSLVLLHVRLKNEGMMMSEPMTGYFDIPSGVQSQQSLRVPIPAIRGRDFHVITFPFQYDADFRGNRIDIGFRASGSDMQGFNTSFTINVSPPVAQNTTPRNTPRGNSGSGGAQTEAWWTSHSSDDKAIDVNTRDVRVKAMVLSNKPMKKGQIGVFINSKKSFGSKMGESDLRPPSNHSSGRIRHDFITKVRLKDGRNKIKIAFRDEYGNEMEGMSETLVLNYIPPGKPNLYVLAIGVDHHDLDYTVKDAKDFAAKFQGLSKDKRLFGKVEVFQVTENLQTTAQNLKKSFIELQRRKITEDDLTVIFISSHGKKNEMGEFLLMPSDYDPGYEDILSLNFKEDILKKLNTVEGKKLMFIDACHSGSVGGRGYSDKAVSKLLNDLMNKASGLEIFASCGSNEFSYEDDAWQNGAFTEAILEALENKKVDIQGEMVQADIYSENPETGERINGPDGVITIEELRNFVRRRVKHLVHSVKDELQVPINQSAEVLPDDTGIFIVGN